MGYVIFHYDCYSICKYYICFSNTIWLVLLWWVIGEWSGRSTQFAFSCGALASVLTCSTSRNSVMIAIYLTATTRICLLYKNDICMSMFLEICYEQSSYNYTLTHLHGCFANTARVMGNGVWFIFVYSFTRTYMYMITIIHIFKSIF